VLFLVTCCKKIDALAFFNFTSFVYRQKDVVDEFMPSICKHKIVKILLERPSNIPGNVLLKIC
jgi:hypothetical protein